MCVLVFVMCRIVRELMRLARPLPRESVCIAMFLGVCESVRLARPLYDFRLPSSDFRLPTFVGCTEVNILIFHSCVNVVLSAF